MLNLLRFRAHTDYSLFPDLAPPAQVSGAAAYEAYMRHTAPFLERAGGEILFYGDDGPFFIGPDDERWDKAMLIRQSSLEAILGFATHEAYLAGLGHRTAALEDSRLLPLVEMPTP